jgi:hypothetical protein
LKAQCLPDQKRITELQANSKVLEEEKDCEASARAERERLAQERVTEVQTQVAYAERREASASAACDRLIQENAKLDEQVAYAERREANASAERDSSAFRGSAVIGLAALAAASWGRWFYTGNSFDRLIQENSKLKVESAQQIEGLGVQLRDAGKDGKRAIDALSAVSTRLLTEAGAHNNKGTTNRKA